MVSTVENCHKEDTFYHHSAPVVKRCTTGHYVFLQISCFGMSNRYNTKGYEKFFIEQWGSLLPLFLFLLVTWYPGKATATSDQLKKE